MLSIAQRRAPDDVVGRPAAVPHTMLSSSSQRRAPDDVLAVGAAAVGAPDDVVAVAAARVPQTMLSTVVSPCPRRCCRRRVDRCPTRCCRRRRDGAPDDVVARRGGSVPHTMLSPSPSRASRAPARCSAAQALRGRLDARRRCSWWLPQMIVLAPRPLRSGSARPGCAVAKNRASSHRAVGVQEAGALRQRVVVGSPAPCTG